MCELNHITKLYNLVTMGVTDVCFLVKYSREIYASGHSDRIALPTPLSHMIPPP